MKREYFGMLFIFSSVALFMLALLFFEEIEVMDKLGKFFVIWLLIAFYAGQYSMKFPKRF